MSSTFGSHLRLSLFGQSHGPAIGMTLDGFPAGMEVDMEAVSREMSRRAPGTDPLVSSRREPDEPEVISGIFHGKTTGQPLCVLIHNRDTRADRDPEQLDLIRPGHGDWPLHIHYNGYEDFRGGGHSGGRLTAPLVFAGALCRQYLSARGIAFDAHILQAGSVCDASMLSLPAEADLAYLHEMRLPVITEGLDRKMEQAILKAAQEGNSLGGAVECRITGVPAGIGEPFFDSMESVLAHLLFSIPAVKGVSFGEGFRFAAMTGTESNDAYDTVSGQIRPMTNHAGGILGGCTDGNPVVFQCCIRATPTVKAAQRTVSLLRQEQTVLQSEGRNDPCILPRVVPVIEAVAAVGMMDLMLRHTV